MRRILRIKKAENVDMPTFSKGLRKALEEIGLEGIGRLGDLDGSFRKAFPSVHAFESIGEGGFAIEYQKNREVYRDGSMQDIVKVDATILPIGTTGSLVQRTYDHLRKVSSEKGYEVFELVVKP